MYELLEQIRHVIIFNYPRTLPSRANAVNDKANADSSLADHGTLLEGVVDSVNAVLLHSYEET